MTNSERAAYIRGLMEGLELDQNSKEVKVLNALVELADDLCLSIEEMEDAFDDLSGQVDQIDEDLGSLEEEYYDLEDADEGCGCGCGHHHDDEEDDDYDEFGEEDCSFEVTCPVCEDTIELNGIMIDEGFIECPNCGEHLEFDLDEIEEDCDEVE